VYYILIQFVAVWYWWIRIHDKILSEVRIHQDVDGLGAAMYRSIVTKEKAHLEFLAEGVRSRKALKLAQSIAI
jgi:hypothetical protein